MSPMASTSKQSMGDRQARTDQAFEAIRNEELRQRNATMARLKAARMARDSASPAEPKKRPDAKKRP